MDKKILNKKLNKAIDELSKDLQKIGISKRQSQIKKELLNILFKY